MSDDDDGKQKQKNEIRHTCPFVNKHIVAAHEDKQQYLV